VTDPQADEAVAADESGSLAPVVRGEVLLGAARLLSWWPGVVVTVAAYVVVALCLYHHTYPNLWGGLAAAVVGTAWYASPMRRIEARRRQGERLRLGTRTAESGGARS
jgi:hypothetical protein